MQKIPYYNSKDHAVFMGGVMVPAGETRLVDAALLPQAEPETVTEKQPDALAELLKGNVADVLAKLPELNLEDIERLGELEQMMPAAINPATFCDKPFPILLHTVQLCFKSCQSSAGFFVCRRTTHSHCWGCRAECGIMCLSKR